MAGLGTVVKSEYFVRSFMNGNAVINGQPVTAWYFDRDMSGSGFMDDRQFPSAHLEIIEGQATALEFRNFSPMDHTIHLHGLDVDQANDGVPQTSQAIPPAGTFTYAFAAPHAGTYHYHCHVDTVIHYHRGMSGAIIVRPPGGETNLAWVGGPTFDEEVLWHLHTYDSSWANVSQSGTATARHRPDSFLINGLGSAEAGVDPFTRISAAPNQRIYLRLVNSGYQWARVRLGGLIFQVVASDGRPMKQWVDADTWEIGPGERYDVLVTPTAPLETAATVSYLDDYTGDVLGVAETEFVIA